MSAAVEQLFQDFGDGEARTSQPPRAVAAVPATASGDGPSRERTGFSFSVPGIPCPWARAGGGATVVRFTPAKQRSAMGAIKMFAKAAMKGALPLEGPVSLRVAAIYPWPASWSGKKRARPGAKWKTSRPDLDNVAMKIVADALNGVAFIDDAQIATAVLSKFYGSMPGLYVTVEALT